MAARGSYAQDETPACQGLAERALAGPGALIDEGPRHLLVGLEM